MDSISQPYSRYLVFIVIVFHAFILNGYAQEKIPVALPSKTDTVALLNYINQGMLYSSNINDKAPSYLIQAVRLLEKGTDPFSIRQVDKALGGLGSYYTFKGNHDSSAYYYTKLLKRGQQRNDGFAIANADIGFGLIADYQADYAQAISHNMDALRYFEKVKDTMRSATILSNIGNTCIRLKQYQKAVDLLTKALNVYQLHGVKRHSANTMANLARAYKGLGNRTKELELKLKAYDMFKQEGYKKGMATVCINLGVFYESDDNLPEAFKYYQLALKYSREIQDKGNIAILFNNMSQYFLKTGKTDMALAYNDSAWYYASRNGDKLSQSDALRYRADILHTLGDHKTAETFSDQYIKAKDSIYNLRMQSQVAEMEVKYEAEKKESQIILLNKQNNIKSLQIKNNLLQLGQNKLQLDKQQQVLVINALNLKNKDQLLQNQQLDAEKKQQSIKNLKEQTRIQQLRLQNRQLQVERRNYVIASALILLIVSAAAGYFYYSRYKSRQDARLRLEVAKQKEIETQSLFDGEQNERIRIARDLHDSIGQMMSVIKMNVSNINHKYPNDTQINNTLTLVDKTITEVRHISHNLIPEELNFGLFAALADMFEKINAGSGTQIIFNIPADVRDHSFEKSNELSIYRIVQEAVGNIVKHAQATQINIDVLRQTNQLTIAIKDNGSGFDIGQIKSSKGIGWKNIAARVNLLDGKLNVQSEKLSGTQIEITIPDDSR